MKTGRTKRIPATGLKPQSGSRSHSTKGRYIRGKRSSTQEPFITASWCQSLRRKLCAPLAIHTSISSRMNYFGNQLKLLNQSKLMENSTLQRHSLRPTVTFRNLLENRDAIFRGLLWVLCLPLMVLSSQHSAPLNYGRFILQWEMSRRTEGQSPPVKHLSTSLTWKQ